MYESIEIIFYALFVYFAYIYVGYFVLLKAMARLFEKEYGRPQHASLPTVSLIISAYNEEKVIEKKILNALALDYPSERLAIYVVSDGSTDGTVTIAEKYQASNFIVFAHKDRRGKNACLNEAMKHVKTDIAVFSDANAMYEKQAIQALARRFHDVNVGCVVGMESRSECVENGAASSDGLYWRYENHIKKLQSTLRAVVVANGPIFAIRTHLFTELYNDVANDFQTPIVIGGMGYANVYEPNAVSYEKPTQCLGEEFGRKVRIVTRGITGFFKLRHHLRGKYLFHFVSHKLLRWMAGWAMIGLLVANGVIVRRSGFYLSIFGLQLVFYGLAAVSILFPNVRFGKRLFAVPAYFTMVNMAALIAWLRYFAGRRAALWEKAGSTR